MRHLVEPVQRRRAQAAVDEERVVVADEREADDADGLEDAAAEECEACARVAFELRVDVRAFDEDGEDDDDHADEREARRPRELVDVAVERERVRDADRAEGDHELAVREPGEDGDSVEVREDGADDVWYCIACVVLGLGRKRE